MMFYSSFALLFAAGASAVISRRADNDTLGGNTVPGAYIVRFTSGHVRPWLNYLFIIASKFK